jgi:hypothetical protein
MPGSVSVLEQPSSGTGHLRSGQRDLGVTHYEIHVGLPNKPGTVVELESPPVAQNGEILELTLEDGRVLQLQVSGVSPYCRVIAGPTQERRASQHTAALDYNLEQGRRRSDTRNFQAIHHPCPRCMASEVLITHRGVMMTALYCTVCHHGWGEPPAVVAAAVRSDRRTIARGESSDRRAADRIGTPSCTYCGTDAYVRSVRRTADEVYFSCDGCQAMFAVSRPQRISHAQHRSLEPR